MNIKKFIIRFLGLIVLPIFIFFVSIEILLRHIPNDYSYKNEWLTRNAKNIKILSLGSSYGYHGIDPQYFQMTSFNAGHCSQTPLYDYLIFNKFIDKMDSLEYLILPISYFPLFMQLEKLGGESQRVKKYFNYYHFDHRPFSFQHNFEFSDFNLNIALKRIIRFYFKNETEIHVNEKGYSPLLAFYEDWENEGLAAVKFEYQYYAEKNYNENIRYLSLIIEKCKEKDVKIFLLIPPMWHTYYENMDDSEWSKIQNTMIDFEKNNEHVFYLNLLKDNRFQKNDFANTTHLSPSGAEKLTKILNEIIMKDVSKRKSTLPAF
jgi:hypothetical protein